MSLKWIEAGLHERRLLNDLFMYYDARLVKLSSDWDWAWAWAWDWAWALDWVLGLRMGIGN